MSTAKSNNLIVSIVEDEPVLRQEMAFQLGHMGFTVDVFDSAPTFYRSLAVRPSSIAVLDIGLPGEDGLQICRHLRAHDSQMGIVFLTARALRDDRLTGLALGADAYLTKPVDMDELALVLRRLATRVVLPAVPQAPSSGASASSAKWSIDAEFGFVTAPNGIKVRLSATEIRLLRALHAKAGAVCSTVEMALALGLPPDEFDKHRVEVIVSRLRSKVERSSGLSLPLEAVRGVGYRLLREG
jgi:DNA-binding response OmpR family regulator